MTRLPEPTWVVDAGPLIDQGKRESLSWTSLLAALTNSPGGLVAVPAPALYEALTAVDPSDWYLIDQTTVRGELAAVVTVVDLEAGDVYEAARLTVQVGCTLGTAHAVLLARRYGVPVLTGHPSAMRELLGGDWLIYPG